MGNTTENDFWNVIIKISTVNRKKHKSVYLSHSNGGQDGLLFSISSMESNYPKLLTFWQIMKVLKFQMPELLNA